MGDKLKELARAVYELTANDIWIGGKGIGGNWPKTLTVNDKPWGWGKDVTWTISPEVVLGPHRVRVCVSWNGKTQDHCVRVLIDDELKHPGGAYLEGNYEYVFSLNWSWKIACQEAVDGGKIGPVNREDDLITAAKEKMKGRTGKEPPLCAYCQQALTELDAELHQGHPQ